MDYKQKEIQVNNILNEIKKEKAELAEFTKEKLDIFESSKTLYLNAKNDLVEMKKQLSKGVPFLGQAYDEYYDLLEKKEVDYLINKSHPAISASESLKEISAKRRSAEIERRYYKYLTAYYEWIAPFLIDFKDEEMEYLENDDLALNNDYNEQEKTDNAIYFLTKNEYRELPNDQKYQMALDRYWQRPHSKREIGKMYERYIGYLYETNNYDVSFHGIIKGFEDLGRDLICKKDNEIIVIQCKYWSKFKTIYEKHVFQFFGTYFEFKESNLDKDVKPIFYTTTELSELARKFSKFLNVEIKEKFPMNKDYPCIKCNISRSDKEKIYHLPFDQMYDKIKIEQQNGEFYCKTIKEAESKGFRRAKRYIPNKQ